MLIDAAHAPLEDAKKAFDGIGVDFATPILTFGMIYESVHVFFVKVPIEPRTVSDNARFLVQIVTNYGQHVALGRPVDVETTSGTSAVNQGEHGMLVTRTSPLAGSGSV